MNYPYNHSGYPNNQVAAKTYIASFLCPSTGNFQPDANGYGQSDYMPVAYTDLSMTNGSMLSGTEVDGLLAGKGTGYGRFTEATDGLSNTVCLWEDAGKPTPMNGTYFAEYENASTSWPSGSLVDTCDGSATKPAGGGTKGRCPKRWADGDTGNGVSGPNKSTPTPTAGTSAQIINNNKSPNGGPTSCPWSTNNCGPNDEPFSFHTGGCHAILGDGSVRFISENIAAVTVARLCAPADGNVLGEF